MARGLAAFIVLITVLALAGWAADTRPGAASADERSLLRAVVAAGLVDDPANRGPCVALWTTRYNGGEEYGYWVSDDADDPRNAEVRRANEIARSADHAVLAASVTSLSPVRLVSALRDRLGCSRIVRLGTPRLVDRYGFVELADGRFSGTAAFERTAGGWRLLRYKERDRTMPVY